MKSKGYLIFHLNLAFSSLEEESRNSVIQDCYHPLLSLVEETKIPIGIELTGWTLNQINQIDANWATRFNKLLKSGACELIGSGYCQIIGPLASSHVNVWNQRLGIEYYQKILSEKPKIAYVNEMAFSQSMVNLYDQFKYKAIIIDSNNVQLALKSEELPTHAEGLEGKEIQILWADSILFQKMQHYVHGDISLTDYLDYLNGKAQNEKLILPLYCNDAEVFDYRPGRFSEERTLHPEGEWNRINKLLDTISSNTDIEYISPSKALQYSSQKGIKNISKVVNANYPVLVKKQNKYNIARWAVTGRDDLWLNSKCHLIEENMIKNQNNNPEHWRELCELWSSDLRTHITKKRWNKTKNKLDEIIKKHSITKISSTSHETITKYSSVKEILGEQKFANLSLKNDGILLNICTKYLDIDLNLRRGCAIKSLAFASHQMEPCIGTIQHGYFDSISLGADYYSGNTVIELPLLRKKITDLELVEPSFRIKNDKIIEVHNKIETYLGCIEKVISISTEDEKISLNYNFSGLKEIYGSVRLGIITLLNDFSSDKSKLLCANGGDTNEIFDLCGEFDHSRQASTFVSSSRGFGASTGNIEIKNNSRSIILQWKPSECAAMPMQSYNTVNGKNLSRLFFSIQEFDDTSKNAIKIKNNFKLNISAS